MHGISMLQDLVTILLVSILIIISFQRLKVPPIIGFLVAGMVVGPYGFNLVSGVEQIEILSEIGIVFLMFLIGIELSIGELVAMWRKVFIGGGVQVFGTIALTTAVAYALGIELNSAVFFGFLLSLSSTAIVLQLLQNRGEVRSLHGKTSVGILIFQDIIVVPMMLLSPLLAGKAENIWLEIGVLVAKILGMLVVVMLLAKKVVPFLFKLIVKTKNQELFLVAVLSLCFSVALLTHSIGLSMALGALFAGLIISESDYSHQAVANVLPFRELFVSFFFVSTGMLLNLSFFAEHFLWVLVFSIGAILIKMTVLWATAWWLKVPSKPSLLLMFYLFQVGEFSLLLSGDGKNLGLISAEHYQYFLAVSILTMAVTPFLLMASTPIVTFILNRILKPSTVPQSNLSNEHTHVLTDHLVIVGYGLNGQNVAKAARKANIPFIIIEFDSEAFSRAKAQNQPVIFGDASKDTLLKHAHIQDAKAVSVTVGKNEVAREIVYSIRRFTKTAYIIARTTNVSEIESMLKAGADTVIPEEYETGIQIFTHILNRYMVPLDQIREYSNRLRMSNYSEMIDNDATSAFSMEGVQVKEAGLYTLVVEQSENSVVGKSIFEAQIRQRFGLNVLAIRRGQEFISEFTPEITIKQDDTLYVFGTISQVNKLNKKLAIKTRY